MFWEDNEGEHIWIRKELVVAYFTGQETRRRGIRRKQLLFDLKEKVRYCKFDVYWTVHRCDN